MPRITSAEQLAEHLESEITAGRILPGDRLDPVRVAADRLGLAPNTVASAYRTLARRGLVVGRGRAGTFVEQQRIPAPVEPAIPDGVVDLASGNPDPRLLPDLSAILADVQPPHSLYGEEPVLPEFEQAVRDHLLDPPGPFVAMSGALDGIERVLASHLRAGDRVGVENPGWPAITNLVRLMRLRPVPISIDEQGVRPDALETVVERLDAIIITSRVQNPTGACVGEARSRRLAEIIERQPGILVIEDDHAGAISGHALHLVGPGRARWAVTSSMSKTIGPDLRVAGLFGDPDTIERVRARQGWGPGWVSHLLQRISARLVVEREVAGSHAVATQTYDRRRGRFLAELEERSVRASAPSGLNVWLEVPDPARTVAAALDAGYAIRSGNAFVIGEGSGVRVTTATMSATAAGHVADAIVDSMSSTRRRTRSG